VGVATADLLRPQPIRMLSCGFFCLQNAKILRLFQTLSIGLPCAGDDRLPFYSGTRILSGLRKIL